MRLVTSATIPGVTLSGGHGPGGCVLISTISRQTVTPAATSSAWDRWHRLVDDLANPDVELTLETVAPIISTFRQLVRAGATFDRGLTVLIGKLETQAFRQCEIGGDV